MSRLIQHVKTSNGAPYKMMVCSSSDYPGPDVYKTSQPVTCKRCLYWMKFRGEFV